MKILIKKIKSNWLPLLMLAIVSAIGVSSRYYLLESHFTHVDDIGVAKTILDRREYFSNIEGKYIDWRQEILEGDKGQKAKDIAKFLDDNSLLKDTAYFFMWWRSILHAVPASWTYAPGQFYLTNLLVNSSQNYSELKKFGRMPSFIFGILAIILLPFLFKKIYSGSTSLINSIIAVLLLSFSWENIIHSVQMESYAIGNLSILIIFFLLISIVNYSNLENKPWFKIGILAAIPGLLQYQALFFIPALFVTLNILLIKKTSFINLTKYSFTAASGFLIIFIIFIIPYLKGDLGKGIHWNSGPDQIFVLNPDWNNGIFAGLKDFFEFLLFNSVETIEAMLSPTSYQISNGYIGWLLFTLSIVGFFSTLLSSNKNKNTIALFSILSCITIVVLLLLQVIPLSPTRHSIIFGIFYIVFIVEGIYIIDAFINKALRKKVYIFLISFLILWSGLFLYSLNYELKNKIDPFNESKIFQSLQLDKIDIVANFDGTNLLYLMPSVLNKYPVFDAAIFMGGDHNDLSLQKKLSTVKNYGSTNNYIKDLKVIKLAYISGNNCFKTHFKRRIQETKELLKHLYSFNKNVEIRIVKSICKDFNSYKEWSPRTTMPNTSNGKNIYSYTVISAIKKDSIQ